MEIRSADNMLREYAVCAEPDASEALLAALMVDHAQPAIRRIVKYKLAFQGSRESQDIEDVTSEVTIELLGRLRAMKQSGTADSIGAFSGYTAVAAYHACSEYLRRKYPNRHRLKTRLRYLLNLDKNLAIWETGPGTWLCGLAKWQERTLGSPVNAKDLLADLPHGRTALEPADLLKRIFDRTRAPVDFDELVGLVGEVWGVDDPPAAPERAAQDLPSGDADPVDRMELKRWMTELWDQIRDLPQPQRAALLLNLRGGADQSAIALLPLAGVASIRQVAETLDIPAEQFAELWNRLPLDDFAIAARLGVTRQQVINLRKSARERLVRRMGGKYRFP